MLGPGHGAQGRALRRPAPADCPPASDDPKLAAALRKAERARSAFWRVHLPSSIIAGLLRAYVQLGINPGAQRGRGPQRGQVHRWHRCTGQRSCFARVRGTAGLRCWPVRNARGAQHGAAGHTVLASLLLALEPQLHSATPLELTTMQQVRALLIGVWGVHGQPSREPERGVQRAVLHACAHAHAPQALSRLGHHPGGRLVAAMEQRVQKGRKRQARAKVQQLVGAAVASSFLD